MSNLPPVPAYNFAVSESRPPLWEVRPAIRLDRRDPYLLLQHVALFVRDQERSLRFFVDGLGFNVALDHHFPDGSRWVAIAPPDGTARLALITPKPGSEESAYIGHVKQVVFLTEDVDAKYREWQERGITFLHPPQSAPWGGRYTRFEDVDGNGFALIGFDEATRSVQEQRRLTEARLEAERRAAWEMDVARKVQARLFPQRKPSVRTLDYDGACFQARQVGGDYYDFCEVGRGRLALMIGDIAGKGIAGALLMANLQANLRSQCAIAAEQPAGYLQSVNQLFYENTADGDYATFFYAEYDDNSRRLRYANCGHLPALLLRRDGALERLSSTATVLGLFQEWDCALEERQLSSGDALLLYTDGITESTSAAGEEFGEARLIEAFRRSSALPPSALIAALVEEVARFHATGARSAAPELQPPPTPVEALLAQQDDITLIIAKVL
ncbi:MAG TPA: SpoIIE family protein phosphatase [Candidatus Acidoferrum sp.]|nr:SpoIIE family protein phosphatase [Candidatus Acidoferrum sp.]